MTQKPSSKSLVPVPRSGTASKALISIVQESKNNQQKKRQTLEFEDIKPGSGKDQVELDLINSNAAGAAPQNIHQQNLFSAPPNDFGFANSQEVKQHTLGAQKERKFKVLVAVLGTIMALSLFFYLMYLLEVSPDDNRPNFLRLLF